MKLKKRLLLFACATMLSSVQLMAQRWVGTWATAEMLVETHNQPPSPGLSGNSFRQIVQTSIGGETIRLKLSNEFSNGTTEIKSVDIAVAKTAGSSAEIEESTKKTLKFNGSERVVMAAKGMVTSDPISFHLEPRQNVAITIHYGSCNNNNITGHPSSRTTSYLVSGNTSDFSNAIKTEHWNNIFGIDVQTTDPSTCAIAVLGNSITDGRGSTTNNQNRWPDVLSKALLANEATKNIGVLNLGIGGNCVVAGGLGPAASQRYARDLFQDGVKYIILYEGINDLGYAGNGVTTANNIINIFKKIISEAHERGIWVYVATITPFKNNSYYTADHERGRQAFNQWVRAGEGFDGIIDFDAAVRSTSDPEALNSNFLFENDYLHLNADGYKLMGESVDISLFTRTDSPTYTDPAADKEILYFEAEDMINTAIGTNFQTISDDNASNSKYLKTVVHNSNLPSDQKCYLNAEFTTTQDGPYYLYARINSNSYDEDSYYVKIDNSDYARCNGLNTGGSWTWLNLGSFAESSLNLNNLSKGKHTITIASRESGCCIDRICISNYDQAPSGKGGSDNIPLVAESASEGLWIEAENMKNDKFGGNIRLVSSNDASDYKYLETISGSSSCSTNEADMIQATFTLNETASYKLYARVKCNSYDSDSYYIKFDNGTFARANGLNTNGEWKWLDLISFIDDGNTVSRNLSQGKHTLTIVTREAGACIDRIWITSSSSTPEGYGKGNQTATSISNVEKSANNTELKIYNLAGQPLSKPQKGYNIINGKTVFIK